MSGLFDRLQNEIEGRETKGGISPLDLADFSAPLRKIIRLLLREVELSFDGIWQAVEAMPEEERMNENELGETLKNLTKQGWLISMGEEGSQRFKVNLRRKPGSNLAKGIWSALDAKIENREKSDPKEETDS